MPNGQIRVGDTATNPQTGKKIRWDGKAWQPVQPTFGERFSQVALGTQHPLDELMGEVKQLENHPVSFLGQTAKTAAMMPVYLAYNLVHHPVDTVTKLTGGQEFQEDWANKNYPGAAGDLGGAASLVLAPEVAGKAKAAVGGAVDALKGLPEGVQRAAQNATVGEWEVEQARLKHDAQLADLESEYQKKVEQVGKKTVEDEAAYKTKVEQAKDDYAKKVAAANKKKIEVSKKESGAEGKRNTFQQPRSGLVYQRLKGMADQVGEMVTQLDKTVRAVYDARYNAFRQAMKGTEGSLEPVQKAVVNAQDNIITGSPESIAIFKNLLKEGEDPLLSQASVFRGGGSGVDVKDVLSSMKSEGERNRFLRSLGAQDIPTGAEAPAPKEGATIPIADLQGYSTELGNKIYRSASLPGDVRRALKSVKEAVDKEITRVADSKGQGAIKRQLDRDWAQYMGDFYDSDGALYKLKNAVNSDRRISLLSGGEGSRIVDAMGNYARFIPDKPGSPSPITTTGMVRSLVKQLRDLPAKAGTTPEEVPRPKFPERPAARPAPEPPSREPFSSREYRKQRIHQVAEGLNHITGWDVASIGYALRELLGGEAPWALAYPGGKRLLARLLTRPGVIEYLSKELPNAARK